MSASGRWRRATCRVRPRPPSRWRSVTPGGTGRSPSRSRPGSCFTSSWDTTVRQWDLRGGEEVRRFSHRLDVNGLAVSRSGEYLLTGSDDHTAYLWNARTGEEVRRFAGHTGFVYAVAFAPDGK